MVQENARFCLGTYQLFS